MHTSPRPGFKPAAASAASAAVLEAMAGLLPPARVALEEKPLNFVEIREPYRTFNVMLETNQYWMARSNGNEEWVRDLFKEEQNTLPGMILPRVGLGHDMWDNVKLSTLNGDALPEDFLLNGGDVIQFEIVAA